MVELGIGRNMVKSVRFWAQAFGLMDDSARSPPAPTPFAHWLLDPRKVKILSGRCRQPLAAALAPSRHGQPGGLGSGVLRNS